MHKSDHKQKLKKLPKFIFNPLEIQLCGSLDSEKFINFKTKFYNYISKEFKIASARYLNKVTDESKNTHAEVCFHNEVESKIQIPLNFDMVIEKSLLYNFDFVFIENNEESNLPKIVFLENENNKIEYENVFASVTIETLQFETLQSPSFNEDNLEGIKEVILGKLFEKTNNTKLYGLVLTGGKSSRMKSDKALLKYHSKTQVEYTYELLSGFCEKVFVSNRKEQAESIPESLPQIHDKFLDFGPMGGILSAMTEHQDVAWVVMACDLPYANNETLKYLLENRDPFKMATAFISTSDSFPEPLCAVYEPKSRMRLLQFMGLGYDCPRKFLLNSDVKLLEQIDKMALSNVNHPEEYDQAVNYLNERG